MTWHQHLKNQRHNRKLAPVREIRSAVSSSIQVQWTDDHQLTVKKLISHLTEALFLAFLQYDKPFAVHVDACEYGLGTALYQRQEGKLRVIAYGSRTLTPAEKNYSYIPEN